MFTFDHALQLTKKMHARYGDGFARQWKGFTANAIAQEFFEELSQMTPEQIARGITRMKTHEFAPNVSQFANWCLGDLKAQWLGANEAWNVARGSIDFNGNELTVVWTKECAIAFDAVADLVKLGDKYQIAEAKKVFIERYERMVAESLERGEKPCYDISYGDDKEQRKTALKQAEIAGYLPSGSTGLMIEQIQTPQQAKSEADKFKATAQEHLEKLGKLIKRNAPVVENEKPPVELFNMVGNLPEWADPFDEREKYVQGLIADKKPIPSAIK